MPFASDAAADKPTRGKAAESLRRAPEQVRQATGNTTPQQHTVACSSLQARVDVDVLLRILLLVVLSLDGHNSHVSIFRSRATSDAGQGVRCIRGRSKQRKNRNNAGRALVGARRHRGVVAELVGVPARVCQACRIRRHTDLDQEI